MLTDPAISHTARMALEIMPYPTAGAALREAAGKTVGLTRSGLIDSLGERREAEAVPMLAAALGDTDSQVRAAAATALGKIGTAKAADSLFAVYSKAEGDDKAVFGLAFLRCIDRLPVQKDPKGFKEFFSVVGRLALLEALSKPNEPLVVRTAALRAFVQSAGPDGGEAIAEALADENPLMRQAAAGELPNLSDAALREVAAKMADFAAAEQIAVLAAIRIRQDKSLAPIVLKAAGAEDPWVQVAAIRALGIVGDASACRCC